MGFNKVKWVPTLEGISGCLGELTNFRYVKGKEGETKKTLTVFFSWTKFCPTKFHLKDFETDKRWIGVYKKKPNMA